MAFAFLDGLDKDIQQTLLNQLRDLWTHTSTAIEGNTLTLGDTKFILDEGLTVSGKPVKDHQEVIGHAKAIQLIYAFLGRDLTEQDFYDLHKAVQSEVVFDIDKPYGAWKTEPNGTYALDAEGQQTFIEYALPQDVPPLMHVLIDSLNKMRQPPIALADAHRAYAKIHMGIVHIHPFWDGNGRVARLVANIPLLNAGLTPLVIATENRREYLEILSRYQQNIGPLTRQTGVWPDDALLGEFEVFCLKSYETTSALLEKARAQQKLRETKKN